MEHRHREKMKAVDEILKSEDEAKRIIENAKIEADEIVSIAQQKNFSDVVEGKKLIDKEFDEEIKKKQKEIEKKKKKILDDSEKEIKSLKTTAKKQIAKAVADVEKAIIS